MNKIIASLPYPPPLSRCYLNNRKQGRVKSPEYNKWIRNALWDLKSQGLLSIAGAVTVLYRCSRPLDNRKRDLGNLEKALSDTIVKAGLIDDDSKIDCLVLKWDEGAPVGRVICEIERRAS